MSHRPNRTKCRYYIKSSRRTLRESSSTLYRKRRFSDRGTRKHNTFELHILIGFLQVFFFIPFSGSRDYNRVNTRTTNRRRSMTQQPGNARHEWRPYWLTLKLVIFVIFSRMRAVNESGSITSPV